MTLNLWKKTSTFITKAYKAKQIKLRDMVWPWTISCSCFYLA